MTKRSIMRRVICAVLLVCMLVGLVPASVFASPREGAATRATYADLTSTIQNLPQVKNVRHAVSTYDNAGVKSTLLDGGTYYIVKMDYDGTTALTTGHLVDPSQSFWDDNTLKSVDVTVSDTGTTNYVVSGAHPDMAIMIDSSPTNVERNVLTPVEGLCFGVDSVTGLTAFPETLVPIRSEPTGYGSAYVSGYGGLIFVSYKQITAVDNTWHWYPMTYDESRDVFYFPHNPTKTKDATNVFRLFRLASHNIELYKAIKAVEGYADGNADGRFDATQYDTFYTKLKSAIDAYNNNNVMKTNAEQATLKVTQDGIAKELITLADKLDMTMVSMESYIDIPVEIMDFRADGLLLEWERTTHGKWNLRSDLGISGGVSAPTELGSASSVITELTQDQLIDGQMIYTEKLVGYVAKNLLKQKYATDWSAQSDEKIPGYNSIPFTKMNSITTDGSYADTINKTDTKKDGGYLKWADVTTYYDMAYYILNNLWRPVKSDDYMDTTKKLGYNMLVPDRKRLRLFKDETGAYTIDAANRMVYNGYYIYNGSEPHPSDAMYEDAYFRPIDNLGFETSANMTTAGGDTDQGFYLSKYGYESEDMNFHFSMHAKGSFVYYRDRDLYFEFIGDDDVYFYINGQIAMDLGGSHGALGKRLYLNTVADELGLEDEGVYSFDMFYIERHTTASNLKFSTNIKIVETETMTTKGMYAENKGGVDMVDSKTGLGVALGDNSLLRDGDIVAYSFDIANSRDIPVYNVSFRDPSLGTYLSPTAVYLCNTALTGGIETKVGDVEFYYRGYDSESGGFYTGYPTTKTKAEMATLISSYNSGSGMPEQVAYRVTPTNVTQMKELLKAGIPANCQLSVYGFKRMAQETLPKYENTATSICYYNLKGTGATVSGVDEIPITGNASRTYQVTAAPPSAEPVEIVLDYGKAVEIPISTIQSNIKTDLLTKVTSFAGIVTSGKHEDVLTYISSSKLLCASDGKTYKGKNGTFTRTGNTLTYQPTKFMESIESVYLAYNIEATNSAYKYMLVELKLLPATSVYYETDFADGAVSTVNGADLFDDTNSFYADFNNTALDQERYKGSVYGGYNYDLASSWGALTKLNGENIYTDPVVDNEAGTLQVSYNGTRNWIWVQANQDLDTGFHLNYHPYSTHVAQLRVKFSNMDISKNGDPYARIYYFTGIDRWEGVEADYGQGDKERLYNMDIHTITDAEVTGGEWVTITFPISGLDSTAHTTLTNLRFQFGNIQSKANTNGSVTFDYIYVGPSENAPSQDSLYFDFGNTPADRNRYSTHGYRSVNFDTAGKWVGMWLASGTYAKTTLDTAAGTLTTEASSAYSKDDCYVETTRKGYIKTDTLQYDPAKAEVLQIRFKMSATATAPKIQFAYGLPSNTDSVKYESTKQQFTYTTAGRYITETVPLSDTVRKAGTIAYIRTQFLDVGVGTQVTIDYIYVGPAADAPEKDYLYFDFTDDAAAKDRYGDTAYGGKNYDLANSWGTLTSQYSAPVVNHSEGTLTTGYVGTRSWIWVQTHQDLYNGFPMSYRPQSDHVVKMRVKFDNMTVPDGGQPNARIRYFIGSDNCEGGTEEKIYETDYYPFDADMVKKGGWVTLTFPVKGLDSADHKTLTNLRFQFSNVQNASSSVKGSVTFDYIYVGTEEGFNEVRERYNQAWTTVSEGSKGSEYQDVVEFPATNTYEPQSIPEMLGAGPAERNEYYGLRNGKSNYANNIPLSFVHRGSFRTSSENSYVAVLDALKLGHDGVEIDLQITSDGVVILCHDTHLTRTASYPKTNNKDVPVNTLTWAQIRDYPLEIANGASDALNYILTAEEAALMNTMSNYTAHYGEAATAGGNHYTARLDDMLELIQEQAPNAILTLDKVDTQEKFAAAYKLVKDKNMLGQVMFKMGADVATLDTWAQAAATACGITKAAVKSSFMMLFVEGEPEQAVLQAYLNDGTYLKAVEVTYGASEAASYEALLTSGYIDFCKSKNIDFYPSTIGPGWAGGRDDDETTWLYYLQMGADGIMTDRGEEFAAFMHYYNGAARKTSELIEAEVFQNYNTDSAKFYMDEAADLSNNKVVNDMHNGDWLEYRKITFTGSEKTLYLSAKGVKGGVLEFYVDSIKPQNCFATASVPVSDFCHGITASIIKTVSAGNHTVFVKAVGVDGEALVTFDSFSCQDHTNQNYLFFDFTNTPADEARYSQEKYGGGAYNFDVKEYWATHSTDSGGSNTYKNFSIDNAKGEAVVHVSKTISDGTISGNPIYGPKFMTTNTYGSFPWTGAGDKAPLKYVPSAADFVAVRFKLDNVVDTGENYIIMEFHYDDAAGTDHIQYENYNKKNFTNYTFVTGEYQTVYIPVTYFYSSAAYITSFGLRFCGIKGSDNVSYGTVTIDYIYAGPLQLSDNLLIDFDGNADSYYDPVYGGKNYDLESAWSHNSKRSTAADISDGSLSYTIISGCDQDYHRMTMAAATMRFVPGDDDYCQIRFKTSGAVKTSGHTPQLHIYFSPDEYNRSDYLYNKGIKGPGGSNNKGVNIDLAASNAGWTIANIPIDTAYYRDAGYIGTLCVMFNKIDQASLATFTIDYIYIGPREKAPDRQVENDRLFFDFTDTAADRERYDDVSYGNTNYDDDSVSNWFDKTHTTADCGAAQTAVIDDGTLILTQQSSKTAMWTETSKPGSALIAHNLKFNPANAEVYQIRFKVEGMEASGSPYVDMHLWSRTATGGTANQPDAPNIPFDAALLNSGEYITLTRTLGTTFDGYDEITNVRIYFNCLKSISETNPGKITIDYFYVGPEEGLPTKTDTYGYDSSYTTDNRLSNGSSLFVEGMGVPLMNQNKSVNYAGTAAYTEASFIFTGTGFDIISRTGADQGLLRAVIYDTDGNFVKTATVINKSTLGTELYQIPVLSIEKLPHGTYTAKIFVGNAYDFGNDGAADDFNGDLDRGGEFYFDAIRIYNPINTSATTADAETAYNVYQKHGEADPVYTEVRNMLITAKSFTAGGSMSGAVYLDAKGNKSTALANYTEVGPNNEVYLASGKAIAFKLDVTGILPASIDIGAKSVKNATAKLAVRVAKTAPAAVPSASDITVSHDIASATQQYYHVPILPSQWTTSSSTSSVYVTVYNNGSDMLSITDIKCAYDSPNPAKDAKKVRFLVDTAMLDEMQVCYEHDYLSSISGDEHTLTCSICDYSFSEAHTYEEGVCICGAKEITEPENELDENLTFTMDITAGAEMSVSYSIPASAVASYEDFFLEVTKEVVGGEPVTVTYQKADLIALVNPITGEAIMYNASYTGINAKEMGDSFETTLCAIDASGKLCKSETVVRSIKDYLLGKLEDANSIPELKTMAVDMLKYGAAAQIRMDYDTDNLVTEDLSAEQLAYATQTLAEAVDYAQTTGDGANINTDITVGARVELSLSCIYVGASSADNVRCVVADTEGNVLEELATTNIGGVMYSAIYNNVGAKQMRDLINVTFYDGDTAISKSICWSVESYVAQVRARTDATEDELNAVNAMLTYGDAVAAYMTAVGQ